MAVLGCKVLSQSWDELNEGTIFSRTIEREEMAVFRISPRDGIGNGRLSLASRTVKQQQTRTGGVRSPLFNLIQNANPRTL
jgi:hypothetical protein